ADPPTRRELLLQPRQRQPPRPPRHDQERLPPRQPLGRIPGPDRGRLWLGIGRIQADPLRRRPMDVDHQRQRNAGFTQTLGPLPRRMISAWAWLTIPRTAFPSPCSPSPRLVVARRRCRRDRTVRPLGRL